MPKGADIIDVLQRMGGVADRMNFRQVAALGSTFLTLGATSEIAASSANAMVRELPIATMQSNRFMDGADITQKLEKRLLSLTLTDNRGVEADQLDMELDDADGQLPRRGVVLSLALGWAGLGWLRHCFRKGAIRLTRSSTAAHLTA